MKHTSSKSLSENRYGLPLPARKNKFSELIQQVKESGGDTHRIENFQGQPVSLCIIRVEINLPKYRIANGRTASIQEEWVALNDKKEHFFSECDPELYTIQEVQHKILADMTGEEGLREKFKNPQNRQVDPLLLDENGFVINGNRRLCCWRSLYDEDSEKYSHFSHVDVVVLGKCDEKELDALESRLQIEQDIRSDYAWHAEAKMFAEKQRKFGYTTKELARQYGKVPKYIEELFGIRELGAEYLKTRNKKNVWSELNETEHTFKKLYKTINELTSDVDKELMKEFGFTYIDNPDAAGARLYTFIPSLGKHLAQVKKRLKEEFPQGSQAPYDGEAVSAFGGSTQSAESVHDINIIAKINESPSNRLKAQDIIATTLESEKSKVLEGNMANFLLKNLQKAQTSLTEAISLGMMPETNTDGVSEQLNQIEEAIKKIREFIT